MDSNYDQNFPERPPSSPRTDIDWNIEYQERHYEELYQVYPEFTHLTIHPPVAHVPDVGHQEVVNEERLQAATVPDPPTVPDVGHQEVRRVSVEQSPNEQEVNSYPVCCHCGYAVEVVVRADGDDIGRRIQLCSLWPNGCNYFEWRRAFPSKGNFLRQRVRARE